MPKARVRAARAARTVKKIFSLLSPTKRAERKKLKQRADFNSFVRAAIKAGYSLQEAKSMAWYPHRHSIKTNFGATIDLEEAGKIRKRNARELKRQRRKGRRPTSW